MKVPADYERVLPPAFAPDFDKVPVDLDDAARALGRLDFTYMADLSANDAQALRFIARRALQMARSAEQALVRRTARERDVA